MTNGIIKDVMTPVALTIGDELPLAKAAEIMQEHSCRHLPVLARGKIVGLVSERDIRFATSLANIEELTVQDAMTEEPYIVDSRTPLAIVCEEMADKKYGCAIVCDKPGSSIGIFTVTDAVRLAASLLRNSSKN